MKRKSRRRARGDAGSDAAPRQSWSVEELVSQHHQELYRYAFRLAGNPCDAEDLTQQTFLIAQQKLHQLREPDKVRSWLFSIVRNCFLKTCRRAPEARAADLQLEIDDVPDRDRDDPIDRERLQMALNELGAEFRVVLVMFYFEQKSYKEIAADLDLKIGTVMSRLSRAKGHLRKRLLSRDTVAAANSQPRFPINSSAKTRPGIPFHEPVSK